MAAETVLYDPNLNARDQRNAILGIGQRRGLWTFWGIHEGLYVVQHAGREDEVYLTGEQVDRLPFDHFADQGKWT